MPDIEHRPAELLAPPLSAFGVADIVRVFAEVRMRLNFPRFFSERWPVFAFGGLTVSSFDKLYTGWYRTDSDVGVNFSDQGARPISLPEAVHRCTELPKQKRARVSELAAAYSSTSTPILELLPAYQLQDGQHLLLDGNHRLVALGASGLRFEFCLLSIRGPLDHDALPDLVHWQRRGPLP